MTDTLVADRDHNGTDNGAGMPALLAPAGFGNSDGGSESDERIEIVGEVVEIPRKLFTDTIGDAKSTYKPIPAHALWVDQATLSGKVGIHASVASYHELSKNGCLNDFCYKVNGTTRQFQYVQEPSAKDVDSLHSVLSFLASHLKGYFREASKAVMVDFAITGGIMTSTERLAGWSKLLSVLFCLGPNPSPKTVHAIDMMMRAPTRRLFVMRTVSEWVESLGRSIRITNKYIGFEKQVMKILASPHENYSGNSFFVEGVKTVKHLTKSAKLALKNGSSRYIYTRRKPQSAEGKAKRNATKISPIPAPSQTVGTGTAEEQIGRLIASHGLETVRLMLSVSVVDTAAPMMLPSEAPATQQHGTDSDGDAISSPPTDAAPPLSQKHASTAATATQHGAGAAGSASLVASDVPVSSPPTDAAPPLSQKHASTAATATQRGAGAAESVSLMASDVPVAPAPVALPHWSKKHESVAVDLFGEEEPIEGAGLVEYMEHRGYDQPIVEEQTDNSNSEPVTQLESSPSISTHQSSKSRPSSQSKTSHRPSNQSVPAKTHKPFGDLTNKASHTAPTGSALKGSLKTTVQATPALVSHTEADTSTKTKKNKDTAIIGTDCGLDHNDLSCSFKMEDTPSCFKGDYKLNVNCTAIIEGKGKCNKPVKPKAWHCRRFATCKIIFCDGCYTNKLLAMEAKRAEEEATGVDKDMGAKRKRGTRRRVKKVVVAV